MLVIFAQSDTYHTYRAGLASLIAESTQRQSATQIQQGQPPHSFDPKIVARIENLEFVEMNELLQDAWAPSVHRRRAPVSDILVWAECFSGIAAILSKKYPAKAAELFAYSNYSTPPGITRAMCGWLMTEYIGVRRHPRRTLAPPVVWLLNIPTKFWTYHVMHCNSDPTMMHASSKDF